MKKIPCWLLKFAICCFISIPNAQAQTNKGFLLRGHIKDHKNSQIKIGFGKELLLSEKDKIDIDSSGDFQYWVAEADSMGCVRITYSDEISMAFYVGKSDSVDISWSDLKPYETLKIVKNKEGIDQPTANWLLAKSELDQMDFGLDSCKTIGEYLTKINLKHKEENRLLKKAGFEKNAPMFDLYAADLFYGNLNLVVTSSFYRELDFSKLDPTRAFPPIVIHDSKLDAIQDSMYQINLKSNPKIDTIFLQKISLAQAVSDFKNNYYANNIAHFRKSTQFRNFIDNYFDVLFKEMYYRGLVKDVGWKTYLNWLSSLRIHPDIIEWLYATRLDGKMVTYAISSKDQLEKEISPIKSTKIQNELLSRAAQFSKIQHNNNAPKLSFFDQTGKTRSLADFKGKYVYLNFWDSNCAPCVDDIITYSQKVADAYKDKNVVFLYVSLDADAETWKKTLQRIKPIGSNGRLTKGWSDEVVKDYAIFAIPKHIIINPEGKITTSNADRLSSLLASNPFRE